MPLISAYWPELMLVWSTCFIAMASPGPSNMAIMGTAMTLGRPNALALAVGVSTGSLTWAILAAAGISALLTSYAWALFALKIAGGLYLLWLAWRSARSALNPGPMADSGVARPASLRSSYVKGLLLHLTNPKAILSWIAIIALGVKPGAPPELMLVIVGGCLAMGLSIFSGYALLFSTRTAVAAYRRVRRVADGLLAVVFGFAGFKLLTARL